MRFLHFGRNDKNFVSLQKFHIMLIKTASFLQSNTNVAKLPKADKPEYAFIGRSNVGKSSLINMLTGNNKLAKVSSTPGKTITINHFIINNEWYLVDLPGYGFAKRSQKDREMWKKMLDAYILGRPNLVMTFVLVDSRIKPQKIDLDFIASLGENQVPFAIIFTKADKLGSGQQHPGYCSGSVRSVSALVFPRTPAEYVLQSPYRKNRFPSC